ncbi:hypothetical protein D3C83_282240 [compost metagenome]
MTLATPMVKTFSADRPPASVDLTRIEYDALASKSKAAAVFRLPGPSMVNAALSASPAPMTRA